VQTAESRQQRVCPGPILTLGEDAAAATTASSVGAADIVTAADRADALLEQVPLAAPGNPTSPRTHAGRDRGRAGGPWMRACWRVPSRRRSRPRPLGGFAADRLRRGRRRRVARRRRHDARPQRLVLLSNPTAVAATVDVRVFGEAGPVEAPSALGDHRAAARQRVLSLAGLAPNLASPVVHVTSTGGSDRRRASSTPSWSDWLRGPRAHRSDGGARDEPR
jgi:hypothetical protein